MNAPDLRDGALPALEGGVAALHIPVVGPTESYPRDDRGEDMATVTELHPVTETDDTQPIPLTVDTDGDIEDQNEEQGSSDPEDQSPSIVEHDEHQDTEPAPVPLSEQADHVEPAPSATPAETSKPAELPPAPELEPPEEPEQLQPPDKPRFVGADLVDKLFYGSIAFSAIGQIMFWGEFFQTFATNAFPGLNTAVPWVIALALGGVMEAGMVVFSDLGFDRRDGHSKAWVPWFLVGVAIACGCIGINVGHWWSDDPTAAITFGAVGAIGFVAHLAKGLNKSQAYIDQCTAIEDENRRRWEHYQQKQQRYDEAIEREREHRRRLELRQASGSAPAASSATSAKPASASKTKPKRTSQKASSQQGPRKATLADAQNLLHVEENRTRIERAEHKAAELRDLLKAQQLEAPHRNTLSNWLPQLGFAS